MMFLAIQDQLDEFDGEFDNESFNRSRSQQNVAARFK